MAEQVAAIRALGIDARVLWGENIDLCRQSVRFGDWSVDPQFNIPAAPFTYKVPPRTWQHLAGLSYGRAALAAVRQIRQQFSFDIVHAHTSWLDGYSASLVQQAFGVPVLLTEHSGPFSTQIDNKFKRYGTALALSRANRILAVSEYMRARMMAAFPFLDDRGIEILGNGFDPSIFCVRQPTVRSPAIAALWIGSFIEIKQPLMMLRAFAAARKRVPTLKLDIAGRGPMERQMRDLAAGLGIAGAVAWHGSLSRRQISDALAESSFLVISSMAETFSMVALEALASGRPVISTRCGGPESIIDTTDLGMLVENSEAGLTSGIEQMAAQFQSYEPQRLALSARVRFSNGVIANRLAALYQEMTDKSVAS